jgi:hypothetical protein
MSVTPEFDWSIDCAWPLAGQRLSAANAIEMADDRMKNRFMGSLFTPLTFRLSKGFVNICVQDALTPLFAGLRTCFLGMGTDAAKSWLCPWLPSPPYPRPNAATAMFRQKLIRFPR